MEIVLVLVLVLVLTFFFNVLWERRWLYYHSFKINGPISFPIIGSTYVFLFAKKNNTKYITNAFKTYGKIFKIWQSTKLLIFTNHPSYVKIVVENCLEKDDSYKFSQYLIGEGIFSASKTKWKKNRKSIAVLFNSKKLNSYFKIFLNHSNSLAEKFETFRKESNDKSINVFPTVQQYTTNITSEISMGAGTIHQNYGHWLTRSETLIMVRVFIFYLHPNFIWQLTRRCREVENLTKNSWDFVKEMVLKSETKDENFNDIPKEKTFVDYLKASSSKIDTKQIIEEIQTLLVAGSSTTATAEATVLLMLALNKPIQNRVAQELNDIFDGTDRTLTIDDLGQMKYLEQVIKETLRLFPVSPIFARSVEKDLSFDGVVVPKGASVVVPIISVHRNEEYWSNPLLFDPDRFHSDVISKNKESFAYIPFGAGPRNCIGMRYAMMSIKVMLATMLRRFEFETDEYNKIEDIPMYFNIITKYPNGHKLRIRIRK